MTVGTAANDALLTLGAMIAERRKTARWTEAELADRVGVSRSTIRKIESGHPGVAIGTVFEAAHLTGVPLLPGEVPTSAQLARRQSERVALLPRRVRTRPSETADDDF